MADKKSMAKKMESKTYTNVRCGHCGKFGHHHSEHSIYKAVGKGVRLGFTSSPNDFNKEMGKTGWKKGDIKYTKMNSKENLESRSKKAGFYVHGHKNFGDVYEA